MIIAWVIQLSIDEDVRKFLTTEAKDESRTINKHLSHILKRYVEEKRKRKACGK
jgi:hypothetical protein